MLDIDTDSQIKAQYKLIEISGKNRTEKFKSEDINQVLKYHKWFTKRFKKGLLLEILPKKKIYDNKEKKIKYKFE